MRGDSRVEPSDALPSGSIRRMPGDVAGRAWDLVVVGGGIYGSFAALEAARAGIATVLVEKDDFGGATSWNSLKILHGGLRYLQGGDLRRFRESVRARARLCREYPDHVVPLACLMPLRGEGIRRPGIFRAALGLNDALARRWAPEPRLPAGRVLTPDETVDLFPAVGPGRLLGGALWHDVLMRDAQRLLMETLRRAAAAGAVCLNYASCERILVDGGAVRGIGFTDRTTGDSFEIESRAVLNCAGPWSDRVAGLATGTRRRLFHPSLAFNVLIDRPPPSSAAVAVRPPGPGTRTFFVVPWRDRTLAGTSHAACPDDGTARAVPGAGQVEAFLHDLGRAIPDLDPDPASVLRVYPGLLPAGRPETADTARRPLVVDHGAGGGPRGLWSISGVKYTTAPGVAGSVVRRIFGEPAPAMEGTSPATAAPAPTPRPVLDADELEDLAARDPAGTRRLLRSLVEEESVVRLDDLVLRRMSWGEDPRDAERVRAIVARSLPEWSPLRETDLAEVP